MRTLFTLAHKNTSDGDSRVSQGSTTHANQVVAGDSRKLHFTADSVSSCAADVHVAKIKPTPLPFLPQAIAMYAKTAACKRTHFMDTRAHVCTLEKGRVGGREDVISDGVSK